MTGPVGPVDAALVPRFAGPATFARLPRLDQVERADVAVVGLPFDAGTSYRPGARFGPAHVRRSSMLLRPYHPALAVSPFAAQQVVDAGDLALTPYSIEEAVDAIEQGANGLRRDGTTLVGIGGDHTVALPLLRSVHRDHGPVAVLHLDAHLDTWDTYSGAPLTHGTVFRRAAEEGLVDGRRSLHVGVRGPLYSDTDLPADGALGFRVIGGDEYPELGTAGVVARMRERLGDGPVYVSVDIDVLDPAHAPGTGTPEPGGLSTRELLHTLRGLAGLPVVGADVVEVSPAHDHAELAGLAAAHVVYELLALTALGP